MQRFCQRARDRKTDMIITASDEAFYTLFSSGDSLPYQVPVVFFGIKYPDKELIASLPNVCGFTANPDFYVILKQAQKVFPQRKEVICVIDNSFLSNKGREDFKQEWQLFQEENPDYKMKLYNTQHESTNHIIAAICYPVIVMLGLWLSQMVTVPFVCRQELQSTGLLQSECGADERCICGI